MNWRSHKKTLPFLALAVLYIAVALVFFSNGLIGDETRHMGYAVNLTQGFFTDSSNPYLGNGPGYPLVLAAFMALGAGILSLKLLNVIFVLIGVALLKKTMEFFTEEKKAILFAVLMGLYPPLLRYIPLLYSEPLAFMIVCAIAYHLSKLFRQEKFDWKQIVVLSFYTGFLVLVKIIFFQVVVLSLLCVLSLHLWKRNNKNIKTALALVGGLLVITPYLLYAYAITGKPFYMGTGGGEILYHRSTPFDGEWGNWFSREDVLNGHSATAEHSSTYKDLSELSKNHRDFYLQLEPLTHMQRDSVFKTKAIANMKEHPVKYIKNTVSNVGRILFHYPFSYREQNLNAFGYLIPNMFIVVLWILSLYPAFKARKRIPYAIYAFMVFSLIYICGIVLTEGRGRNFIIMVPALVIFMAYVYTNVLRIDRVKSEH
ncbi:ArnT family glycosyltransferase [Maribacter algicola]|uniref:ArnT family glycosyltransferase n=1 Tax=Meishania litoralis TaxID=3434685 RepID=A0ACC7LIS8_9FLAO